MGRLIMGIRPLDAESEGFAIPRETDGVDIKRISGREGFHRQLGQQLNTRTVFKNSKTGKDMEEPDWHKED